MLISAVIPLTRLNDHPPEPSVFHGRGAHALFLDLVRRVNPALAESLHAPRGDKPFTVGLLPARLEPVTLLLRLTAYNASLAQLLAEQVLPQLPAHIRLGQDEFRVNAPLTDTAQHAWAGTTTSAALVEKWFDRSTRAQKDFTLEFASPTAYRQIHRNVLVPAPGGIFPGYLAAWNANCQPRFEDDLLALVETQVAISRYNLKTRVVNFGDYQEAGCVGQCGYTIFSDELALRRLIHLLADYAFYCGTGYKTTQGMGQTRKL